MFLMGMHWYRPGKESRSGQLCHVKAVGLGAKCSRYSHSVERRLLGRRSKRK